MMNLDWPNLIAGGVVGLLLIPVPQLIIAILKRATGIKPSFPITGAWYSAEYDVKSSMPDQKNTILKVDVKQSLLGRITIRGSETIQLANEKRPTSWVVQGEMQGNVLVGKWVSTVPNSNRHGAVLMVFYDDGRGIGYYLGYTDVPVYGYWLLSRDETDLTELSTQVMKKFKWSDLKKIVDACDPRSNRHNISRPTKPSSGRCR